MNVVYIHIMLSKNSYLLFLIKFLLKFTKERGYFCGIYLNYKILREYKYLWEEFWPQTLIWILFYFSENKGTRKLWEYYKKIPFLSKKSLAQQIQWTNEHWQVYSDYNNNIRDTKFFFPILSENDYVNTSLNSLTRYLISTY